jgi:hypothetical protein
VIHLTLLHINDLHGRVSQLSRVAILARRIRCEVEVTGGYCLFLDAGDSEDPRLLESGLTKGSARETILRGSGCEYVASYCGHVRYDNELRDVGVEIRGKPLEKEHQYLVVGTDMEFADYITYLVIAFERMEFEVPTIMPDVLEDYITRLSPLHAPEAQRVQPKAK